MNNKRRDFLKLTDLVVKMGKIATVGLVPAVNGQVMNTVFSILPDWNTGVNKPVKIVRKIKPNLKRKRNQKSFCPGITIINYDQPTITITNFEIEGEK